MPGYKPTQNAQDVRFSFELYGGPSSFSLTIPQSELSSYALGTEILIGNKYIGEVTKRTKIDDYTYFIEGDGYKNSLKGMFFKGKYNMYDDEETLLPGATEIDDIGDILDDVVDYISPLGLSFDGTSPYVVTGIAPYNCDITGSVADIITHVAQAAGKGWYIDQNKKIKFSDVVKYEGSEFEKEVSCDIVNVLIIKGNLKPPYLDSTSELDKFKHFTTIIDNTGLFCPSGYIGLEWESQETRFESPCKIFIYSDDTSITTYGRKEADIEVPYIDSNTEAYDFALEYFLNNASPIRSETSYTIDVTEEYPHEKGAKKTSCSLLPTSQLRADYYYYSSEDSIYDTEFIKWVKDNNKESLINELDLKAPKVRLIQSEPNAYKKSYKKIKSPMYIAGYAKDDISVDTVKFYLSKYDTQQSEWGAYTLIGDGAWQDPPDSDSEGYYEYNQSSGYYDLETFGGLTRGDIFRIKSVAKDTSGNAGEHVREYQLDDNAPNIYVSTLKPSSGTLVNAASTIEVPDDTFRLKIHIEDLSVTQSPSITYRDSSGTPIGITIYRPAGENYIITGPIPSPAKGEYRELTITTTNMFGQVTKSHHYIKGVERHGLGAVVTVKDPPDPPTGVWPRLVTNDTCTAPEFTTGVELVTQYKEDFYKVTADGIKFNIYGMDSNGDYVLSKTLTSSTEPKVFETSSGSGVFKLKSYSGKESGDYKWLGLSVGVYGVSTEITKKETFIDEDGNVNDGEYTQEGEKTQLQIVAKTNKVDKDEIRDRINITEADIDTNTTNITTNSSRLDDQKGKLKDDSDQALIQYNSTPGTWQVSYNGGTSWVDLAADPSGVTHETFTLNNDNTATQYIYLKFDTDHSTDKGLIRFDKTNKKLEASVDNGSTWSDMATGVNDAIQKTVSGTTYKLKVDATTGALIFEDADTPTTLFKVNTDGSLVFYGDIEPDTDDSHELGASNKRFTNGYFSNTVYTEDIIGTDDGTTERWNITWDGTEQIAFIENIAIGFMDG